MEVMGTIRLTNDPAAVFIYTTLGAIFIVTVSGHLIWKILIATAIITGCGWLVLEHWRHPFPDPVNRRVYLASAIAICVIIAIFVRQARQKIVAVCSALAMPTALVVITFMYQQYPTVRSFFPSHVPAPMNYVP